MSHVEALELQIAASPSLQGASCAASVELARSLARQMDCAGASAASRLSASYLSVLKDLRRLAGAPLTTGDAKPTGKLAELRAARDREGVGLETAAQAAGGETA